MNPFEEKPQKIEKSFQSWKNVLVKPYDKQTVDPDVYKRQAKQKSTFSPRGRFEIGAAR